MVRAAAASSSVPISSMTDDLRHVVLHRLDHHRVLHAGRAHLHAAGAADGRMGDVAVAGDLVGGVDDHDPLVHVVGEDAGDLAQHRRLADAGPAQQEDALARPNDVLDDREWCRRRRGRRGR